MQSFTRNFEKLTHFSIACFNKSWHCAKSFCSILQGKHIKKLFTVLHKQSNHKIVAYYALTL